MTKAELVKQNTRLTKTAELASKRAVTLRSQRDKAIKAGDIFKESSAQQKRRGDEWKENAQTNYGLYVETLKMLTDTTEALRDSMAMILQSTKFAEKVRDGKYADLPARLVGHKAIGDETGIERIVVLQHGMTTQAQTLIENHAVHADNVGRALDPKKKD